MHELKFRTVLICLTLFSLTLLLAACSYEEVANQIGSCCGAAPLPLACVGLVLANRWRNKR